MLFQKVMQKIYGGETIPRLFSKKSKVSIFLDEQYQHLYSFFLAETTRKILKLRCWTLHFTSYNYFTRKKDLEIVSLPHFLHKIWKKKIFHVIFYYLVKFHCLIGLPSWDVRQCANWNYLSPSLWRYKFFKKPLKKKELLRWNNIICLHF